MQTNDLTLLRKVVNTTMTWNYRVWGFGEAISLRGLLRAGEILQDKVPLAFVHGVLRSWLGRGVANSPEDHVGAGRELIAMHRVTGDPAFLEAARKMANLHAQFAPGPHGARCHRPDTPGWRHQIWVDCMDVDGPFLTALGQYTGETVFTDQGVKEILGYARTLQNDNGLLSHGFEKDAGRNGELWARGNGWALMGLVDTLVTIPRSHPDFEELLGRTLHLVVALKKHQHSEGLWHTVIDQTETYLESTLAAMTAYSLNEAFEHGLLEQRDFADMALRARRAMLNQVDANGALKLVSDATPVGALSTYASRRFGVFPWGQGPLLLALSQEMK